MQVLKFGGTSVGSAARMKEVFQIITSDNHQKIVVLSAVSGTTNSLLVFAQMLANGQIIEATAHIDDLEIKYHSLVD
jgi:aspartate kinase